MYVYLSLLYKNISRSSGRSAVACAAYRSGEELEDVETGITHDYRKKTGIAFAEIFYAKMRRKGSRIGKNSGTKLKNRESSGREIGSRNRGGNPAGTIA